MRVDQFPARPRNISSPDRNQNGSRLLSFVYVAQHKPMKHHRDSFVSGSFREGGLWAAFYVHYAARTGTLLARYPRLVRSLPA